MKTYIFKTQLFNAKRIQREIEVLESFSLYELAEAIVGAYDFDFDHAFGFFKTVTGGWNGMANSERYEIFADLDPKEAHGAKSVKKTTIGGVWKNIGDNMLFLFDYGDEWRWIVTLKAFSKKEASMKYPRLLSIKGNAPAQYPDNHEE